MYHLKVGKKYDCSVNPNFKTWLNPFTRGLKSDNPII